WAYVVAELTPQFKCKSSAFLRCDLLGKSVDCPIIGSKLGGHYPRKMRVRRGIGEAKQHHREDVLAGIEEFAVVNFKGSWWSRREELLQAVAAGVLACRVGQHHHPGFMILVLPGLKKAIGGG